MVEASHGGGRRIAHLGQFQVIRQNFEKVILLIIFLSLLPTFIEIMRARRSSAR